MANRSGLVALSDGVRAFFAANGVAATVTPVGWRYRSFQVNQGPGGGSRVCFIPGKIDPTSPAAPKVVDAGTFEQPRLKTANPRPLAQWSKVVTLSVWGVDTSDLENDELQLAATENLLESTYQAMHAAVDPVTGVNVGLADVVLRDAVWTLPPVELGFGREFVAYFVHRGPLFDLPIATTTPQPLIVRGTMG